MSGRIGLHGGGEYVAGDERAMDALLVAAVDTAARDGRATSPRIVIVPTAAARQRPDLAATTGERAFTAAGRRAGVAVEVAVAQLLTPDDAADTRAIAPLEAAHLIHLPGGDPDVIPAVLRGSPAWAAMERAHGRGAVLAGASAGAMALTGRCWTPGGPVAGLGLLPGLAVLPHDGPGRLERWRAGFDGVTWLAIEERTLVLGRPGGAWRVAGRGRARLIAADGRALGSAGPGETIVIG